MDLALSFLNQHWTPRTAPEAPRELVEAGGYDPRIAKLLAARGVETAAEAERFLDPGLHRLMDPWLIHQMDAAVDRTAAAIRRRERIFIYGDYDVDGQASAALLYRVIRDLGGEASTYIPNRLEEGYGLSVDALARLKREGATILLTVDCGVTATVEAAWARENGIDLVITDHHQPADELPAALAVVNPKLGAPEPLRDLAGAGVAFKLAEALAEALGKGRALAHRYVELAALGTVADVAPLLGENRSLVRAGLDRLSRDCQIPGLMALKEVAGIEGEVTTGHIAFGLGPRLNAAGRIADASEGVKLLVADEYGEALPIAERLDRENEERRRIERQIDDEADRFLRKRSDPSRDRALVAWGEGWHPGVIGIVASRVVERYYRPAVVLAVEGELARGSARGIPGLNLYEALSDCKELFEAFGGHEGAAGLTLRTADLEAFRERFHEAVSRRVDDRALFPALEYDDAIDLGELTFELAEEVQRLAPFGVGNPAPVFVAEGVGLKTRPVGKDGSHLKFTIHDAGGLRQVDGIGFGLAEKVAPHLAPGRLYDVAFVPQINEWNGRRTLSAQVKDVRALRADPGAMPGPFAALGQLAAASELAVREAAGGAYGAGAGEAAVWNASSGPPGRWNVVDRRGAEPVRVLEELARAGRAAYVITGLDAGRVAQEIAAFGYRDRTAVLGEGCSARIRQWPERAFGQRPWIAVASGPPDSRSIESVARALANGEGRIAAVLWDVPADVRELLAHFEALGRAGAHLDCYLAHSPQDEEGLREGLLRRFPDRDRLGRLYVAIRGEFDGGEAFTPGRALGSVERKWPGVLSLEGVRRGIEVFCELGLARPAPRGYSLSPEPASKVDLEGSLRYNEFTRIRERLLRSAKELETAPPERFFSLLWEMSGELESALAAHRR